MAMNRSTKEYGLHEGIEKLTREHLKYGLSEAGKKGKIMSAYDVQELLKRKLDGDRLSDEVIRMRDEGW